MSLPPGPQNFSTVNRMAFEFLNGTYPLSNYSTGQDIAKGEYVPRGFRGILTEEDIIFTTSGGKVRVEKEYVSGGRVRQTGSISTSQSGFAAMVFDEGERPVLVCDTAGTGVIDLVLDGFIEQKLDFQLLPKSAPVSIYGRGGF